jgi:4a-hydroxytetrahydrobiopterin dehydratase
VSLSAIYEERVVTDLAGKRCKPCEGGVKPLSAVEAKGLLAELHEGWALNDAATSIECSFDFPAFSRTIAFVNAVAFVATNEGHHPQMIVNYGSCRIIYTTTAISGLSDNDFICAAKIDRLAAEL